MACVVPKKTAWGAKLILAVELAYPVSCASLDNLLMTVHCHFCLNVCLEHKIVFVLLFFHFHLQKSALSQYSKLSYSSSDLKTQRFHF